MSCLTVRRRDARGDVVGVYDKTHLYVTDEAWATEEGWIRASRVEAQGVARRRSRHARERWRHERDLHGHQSVQI